MQFEELIQLIEKVSESELTGFKYEESGLKLHLTKKKGKIQAVASQVASTSVSENSSDKPEGKCIKSPLVGTFYAAPAEGEAPFVSVGDTVTKGQTLAIVEAMKLMNEIESEYEGTITEILVENGQAVEYGQPLFYIG